MKTGKRLRTNDRTNYKKTNTHAPTTTVSFFGQTIPQDPNTDGVHSYFSFGGNDTQATPIFPQRALEKSSPGESSPYTQGRRKRQNLPLFKLEFDTQQKPMEIQVLNELVKHIDRLNVNAASRSTHLQSPHVLLVFANDSSIYELLFESSSWPHSICGLPFKVTLLSRIPTSYSVLVNRILREWHVDSIRPLIAQRYLSTVQVARIFRDGQPINRIRVDFRSNEDVQKIVQCSTISSRCLQTASSNRSMLSLSTVRTQSLQLLKQIEMLQVRRKPRIQSRLSEYCQMRQLQCPTHGWVTALSSEDFLSSRKETTTRRQERN